MSIQGQITMDMQITGSSALLYLVPILIVNKFSKLQMDTFDSFWEMDSDKTLNRKLNLKLNQCRCWRWRRSDDNSSKSRAKNCWVRLLLNYNIKYICTIYTRLDTCSMCISRFSLRDKVTLRLLKLYFNSRCGRVV